MSIYKGCPKGRNQTARNAVCRRQSGRFDALDTRRGNYIATVSLPRQAWPDRVQHSVPTVVAGVAVSYPRPPP